jgi:hypothetical protein
MNLLPDDEFPGGLGDCVEKRRQHEDAAGTIPLKNVGAKIGGVYGICGVGLLGREVDFARQ